MDRLHARYPFTDAAREAVERAGLDLAALVEGESAVVDRAVDRVETAIAEGRVGDARRPRVELLSYPVARVLVSLVDDPDLTRAYAAAEAATAHDRFVADVERPSPDSVSAQIDLDRLLREFDLAGAVAFGEDCPWIDVGPYLRLAGDRGGEWRLARRDLAEGAVPVDREELYELLRTAVRDRVAEGLPLSVPDAVADGLADRVASVERALADTTPPEGIDVVDPDGFPPCVTDLVERAREGPDDRLAMAPQSAFALVAFLASIGMDHQEVAAVCEVDPDAVEYRLNRIAGENGADYPAPSCATMQAYGDCVAPDRRAELCGRIDHPTTFYGVRVGEVDPPEGAGSDSRGGTDVGADRD